MPSRRPHKAHAGPREVASVKQGPKLLLVGILVAAGATLAYAGAAPQGLRSVEEVVADPGAYAGEELELKASVVEGSLNRTALPVTFLVQDGAGVLEVRWDPALPLPDHEAGGTIEGKNVVLHGTLHLDERGPYLLAHDMQVGCASKYRPAE